MFWILELYSGATVNWEFKTVQHNMQWQVPFFEISIAGDKLYGIYDIVKKI